MTANKVTPELMTKLGVKSEDEWKALLETLGNSGGTDFLAGGARRDKKPLVKRRWRKALRPAAERKVCAEFKFFDMGSRGWHFTLLEGRMTKCERFTLAALVLVAVYLLAAWLAKH